MKNIIVAVVVSIVLITGAILFVGRSSHSAGSAAETANNVTVVDGKQVIEIAAKGGYSPRMSTAKADMPTVLKMSTNGTFDCSSSLNITSLGYQNHLPSSGETLIDVPPQKAGTTIQGVCAMGMYSFSVTFS